MNLVTLSSPITVIAADGDTPSRTIAGTAVTYGTVLSASSGPATTSTTGVAPLIL